MAFGAISLIIAAVASAGSVAVAAVGAHEQAIATKDDAQMRANQAKLEAGQKQIQIRQNMLRALASQNAAAGVSGIGTGGSFGANVQRQLTQNQNDLLALSANTSSLVQEYNAQGAAATAEGNIKIGSSLLDQLGPQQSSLLSQGQNIYATATAPALS